LPGHREPEQLSSTVANKKREQAREDPRLTGSCGN
jgi:hypothetical protein